MKDAEQRMELRKRYVGIDAATVADILDEKGHPHQVLSTKVQAVHPEHTKVAGWAYTIKGEVTPFSEANDPAKSRAITEIPAGSVSVWSGGRVEGVCLFGELLSHGMAIRGCTGAVADGGVRDVEYIAQMGFPVFARYKTPAQSTGRWKVNAWQVPIFMPGALSREVAVHPGDFILGDQDGVVVIPQALVIDILPEAEQLTATEKETRKDLQSGLDMNVVLEKYGRI